MDKQNKGLVDNGEGDFILNESGTSVTNDSNEGGTEAEQEISSLQPEIMERVNKVVFKKDEELLSNDIASDQYSRSSEEEIKPYDDVFGDDKPHEDSEQLSGADGI
jgi:hypothetical protein